jgi:hypothetical protein
MQFRLVLLAFLGVQLAAVPAHAWSDHFRITRQALLGLPELAGREVVVTPFQAVLDRAPQLLWELGYEQGKSFNETLEIRKEFTFAFKAGEEVGKPVSALDVLSTYSDEPDWQMDQQLFDDGEYPELWKPEYAMMGGKKGVPSQAFRHMYWRSLSWREPLQTLHLPPQTFFRSMGEAPERARVFVTLSRAASNVPGLEYWAVRFLADALHYLEDVSQPFHSSQIPTPKFLAMPFFDLELGTGAKNLILQVQNILTYYHFGYEDYVAVEMSRAADGTGTPEAREIVGSLSATPDAASFRGLEYADRDPAALVQAMSEKAVAHAYEAGQASVKFFPPLTVKYAELNASVYMNDAWWKQVIADGETNSPAKKAYFGTVEPMFTLLGEAVRRIVSAEVRFPR